MTKTSAEAQAPKPEAKPDFVFDRFLDNLNFQESRKSGPNIWDVKTYPWLRHKIEIINERAVLQVTSFVQKEVNNAAAVRRIMMGLNNRCKFANLQIFQSKYNRNIKSGDEESRIEEVMQNEITARVTPVFTKGLYNGPDMAGLLKEALHDNIVMLGLLRNKSAEMANYIEELPDDL